MEPEIIFEYLAMDGAKPTFYLRLADGTWQKAPQTWGQVNGRKTAIANYAKATPCSLAEVPNRVKDVYRRNQKGSAKLL